MQDEVTNRLVRWIAQILPFCTFEDSLWTLYNTDAGYIPNVRCLKLLLLSRALLKSVVTIFVFPKCVQKQAKIFFNSRAVIFLLEFFSACFAGSKQRTQKVHQNLRKSPSRRIQFCDHVISSSIQA